MRIRKLLLPVVASVLMLSACTGSGRNAHAYNPAISVSDLQAQIGYLASDELAGRQVGTPGIARAEDFIAGSFRRAGLSPLGGRSSFFLSYELYRRAFDGSVSITLSASGGSATGKLGTDFEVLPLSGSIDATYPLVFAGYGITAPEHSYDDYAGLDVRGKFVLMLRHEPDENDPNSVFDGTKMTEHAYFLTKARNAYAHGAKGMFVVTDPINHTGPEDLRSIFDLFLTQDAAKADTPVPDFGPRAPHVAPDFPVVQISQGLARRTVAAAGADLSLLQRQLDTGTPAASLDVPRPMTAHVDLVGSARVSPLTIRDVAGYIRGSDPELRNEWIVVGAHHDHLGKIPSDGTGGDTIYNGADDNASGTAGVLELADYFGRDIARDDIRRSILFITYSAEEEGLLGSQKFEASGILQKLDPHNRIVFDINMDMIGRNPARPVEVWGDGYGTTTRQLLQEEPEAGSLALGFTGRTRAADSDFYTFFQRGIPYVSLFTGYHDDYHEPSDSADKIAYDHEQKILTLAAEFVRTLVSIDAVPAFQ